MTLTTFVLEQLKVRMALTRLDEVLLALLMANMGEKASEVLYSELLQ